MKNKIKAIGGIVFIAMLASCDSGASASVDSGNGSDNTEPPVSISTTNPISSSGSVSISESISTIISTGPISSGTSNSTVITGDEPADTYMGDYYNTVSNTLRGDDLKRALSTVTSAGFVNYSYESMWSNYPKTDVSGGKMILFYTATALSYTSGSATSKSNKEHVWPQSWYGAGSSVHSNGSPGADIHNVYPCDSQLNNVRGNSAFDILPYSSPKVYERGSSGTYGEGGGNLSYGDSSDPDSYNYTNSGKSIFYPKKGYRGITARALMYVATRYYNNSSYPVELVDVAQTSAVTGQYGRIGKLSTLLKWHLEEPVSDFEIARNESIYTSFHKNRNPFVDKPSYACRIFGDYNDNTRAACNAYTEPASDVAPLDLLITVRLTKGAYQATLGQLYIPNKEFEIE